MTDSDALNMLESHLYSAFPAHLTTGIRVWMVNLRKGAEIIHGEGSTLRDAIHDACRQYNGAMS